MPTQAETKAWRKRHEYGRWNKDQGCNPSGHRAQLLRVGNGMLVIRRGKGEIAMAGGRACKVLRSYMEKSQWQTSGDKPKIPILSPDERNAGERKIVTDKEVRGYAPLYPLPTIIALSFQLDCVEAHLFRRHVCSELMRPRNSVIPIIIYDRGVNS